MILNRIVWDALGGYLVGFGAGLSSTGYRKHEIDFFDRVLNDEEKEIKGLEKKYFPIARKYERKKMRDLPLISGLVYSSIQTLLSSNPHETLLENAAVAIPAAYLGYLSAAGIKKLKYRKYNGQLDLLDKMRADPENAESLLSDEKRTAIEREYETLEGIILEEDADKRNEAIRQHGDRLCVLFEKEGPIVGSFLYQRAKEKGMKLIEKTTRKREIRDFYQSPLEGRDPFMFAFVGKHTEFKTVSYAKKGDRLLQQEIDWKNMSIIEKDGRVIISGKSPDVITLLDEEWRGYERVCELSEKEKGTVISITPEELPEKMYLHILTQRFIPEVYDHIRKTRND